MNDKAVKVVNSSMRSARRDPAGWLAGWQAWVNWWAEEDLRAATGGTHVHLLAESRPAALDAFKDAALCNEQSVFGDRPTIHDGVERLMDYLG